MKIRNWSVYALTDEEGVIRYIGKTFDIKTRLIAHLTIARRTNSKRHVVNWIRRLLNLGQRPGIVVLCRCQTETDCLEKEILWISYYRQLGNDLCNATDGGEGCSGYKPSMETRILLSMSRKGIKRPPLTEEHRRNLSIAKKGKPGHSHSSESKRKIGAANKGRVKSIKGRQSLSKKRRVFSDEQVFEIRRLKETMTFAALSRKYGRSACAIQRAVHGNYAFPPQ